MRTNKRTMTRAKDRCTGAPIGLVLGVMVGLVGATAPAQPAGEARSERSIELPAETATFKPGPHQTVAQTYCLICHSADYVYMQPPQSRDGWKEVVTKMQKTFGCPIPDSQVPDLVEYLHSQNGGDP